MTDSSDHIKKLPYSISIRFTPNGFSLSVLDDNGIKLTSKSEIFDFENKSEEDILNFFLSEKELNLQYHKVRLIFETDTFTIVPIEILDQNNLFDFLKFQHPEISQSEHLITNLLPAWSACIILSIPQTLFDVLSKTLPEVEIEHHIVSFINDNVALQSDSHIYINIRAKKVDFVIIKNGALQLVNYFDYQTNEDIVFHIINTCDQLQMQKDTCKITIHGKDEKGNLLRIIRKYIPNCDSAN